MNEATQAGPSRSLLYPAAISSLVAGLVQLRVVPQHFEEWWAYGAFFLVVALAQSIYGTVLLLWPVARVFLVGLAGNAIVVLAYLFVRSPVMGMNVGVLDLLTMLSGTVIIVALGWLLLSHGAAIQLVGISAGQLTRRGERVGRWNRQYIA